MLSPASNDSEDLEFDKFSLKIFDPSNEKKYNMFRISYFIRIIPNVIAILLIFFGIYTLTYYILLKDNLRSFIRLIVFILLLMLIYFMRMGVFRTHYYIICRVTVILSIITNFVFFMSTESGHFTYNFIIILLIFTYNLNLGYVISLSSGCLHLFFYFLR